MVDIEDLDDDSTVGNDSSSTTTTTPCQRQPIRPMLENSGMFIFLFVL